MIVRGRLGMWEVGVWGGSWCGDLNLHMAWLSCRRGLSTGGYFMFGLRYKGGGNVLRISNDDIIDTASHAESPRYGFIRQ